jgi:hypothetical protein
MLLTGVAATDPDFFRIRREKLEPRPSVAHKSVRHAGIGQNFNGQILDKQRE